MTTIAWDGKTLAGDAFSDLGGMKSYKVTKVWKLNNGGLFGGAGATTQIYELRDYLNGGPPPTKLDDIHAIHVRPDGEAMLYCNSLYAVPVPVMPYAVGSGREYAIAAMVCGKSPLEAVLLACQFDTFSGLPITSVGPPEPYVAP